MTDTTVPNVFNSSPNQVAAYTFEQGQTDVGQLLADLQDVAPAAAPQPSVCAYENQLALVRLGMATSLFYALRAKHAVTAAHSLRVALFCSAWAHRMGLDQEECDRIEVAALLHDLGKIGIPDRILRKPGKLNPDEQLVMDCCPQLGCEILKGCTNDQELLNIVLYSSRWYDSRRHEDGLRGAALPLGSRMLAIADAFDAMTTDSVYRSAMSRERAIQELLDGSCTQFDPELAIEFSRMLEKQPELLHGGAANRWLQQLQPENRDVLWSSQVNSSHTKEVVRRETLFLQQLLGSVKDGVTFTDAQGNITHWNSVMQRLTGVTAEAIVGQSWNGGFIGLTEPATDEEAETASCLLQECFATSSAIARPMQIERAGQENTPVHVQVAPVFGPTPGIHGTVVVVRDLSDQTDLEEQLESLHLQTTLDALTGVANRSYFDKSLEALVSETTDGGASFSLIICDIDHFKRVNDVHGHPAGDEALIGFASVLTAHSREGDIVARYGGEEFLLLAPNCDNATAARRAEAIRQALEGTSLPSLGGECVTASFGVTEFQLGDSDETVLARADRALLKAKDNGRNRVVQLGSGDPEDLKKTDVKRGWFSWFDPEEESGQHEFDVVTPVPVEIAIEKLRGFIADHNAEIVSVNENQLSLKLSVICTQGGRRRVDQQIALRADLTLSERKAEGAKVRNTNVHVSLEPVRSRDRRNRELSACYAQVLGSFKSYLMGEVQRTEN